MTGLDQVWSNKLASVEKLYFVREDEWTKRKSYKIRK